MTWRRVYFVFDTRARRLFSQAQTNEPITYLHEPKGNNPVLVGGSASTSWEIISIEIISHKYRSFIFREEFFSPRWETAECLFVAHRCVSGPRLGCALRSWDKFPERQHGSALHPEQPAAQPLWPSAPCSAGANCGRQWQRHSRSHTELRKSKATKKLVFLCPCVGFLLLCLTTMNL